jgi:cobalt-zinc-cadmium efflux system outer membrane protein
LPINVFNRNQGNIHSAQYNIKLQETLSKNQESKIENEVNAACHKLEYFQQVNSSPQIDFAKRYDELFQNMLKTYQARQISLLEFVDFADAYKDTKIKLLEQQNGLLKAIEELNYATNSTIIHHQ